MKSLLRIWQYLTALGSNPEATFLELKRLYMVNIIALVCIGPALIFSIINYFEGRSILSVINFLTAVNFIAVLLLQYFHKPQAAKVCLLLCSFILFFIGGLIYRNGGEYFLLSILVVSMLVYDRKHYLILGGIIITIGIIAIYYLPELYIDEVPVPRGRATYNIASSLFFIIIALIFFKHIIYHDKLLIENQRSRLAELNIEKEKIFSILAHDVKSPLINTENIIEMFEADVINKEQLNTFIQQLKIRLNEQKKAVESILEWSAKNIRGDGDDISCVHVKSIVFEIINESKLQWGHKDLSFDVNIDHSACIYTDKERIKIVLRNILHNAIKFSYSNQRINIYSYNTTESFCISIQDFGTGISNTKINKLFKKVQSRSLGTANEPGSGIGLLMSKDLILSIGGEISVKSEFKNGTTFEIRFPKSLITNDYNVT